MEGVPLEMNNNGYQPLELSSESAVDRIAKTAAVVEAHNAQLVEEAIQKNPDKEPFSYQQFTQLYWCKDLQGDVSPEDTIAAQEAYRRRYYFSDAQTMEKFARELENLDAQSGN